MKHMARFWKTVLLLLLVLCCRDLLAQGDDMDSARALYAQGQEKFDQGDVEGALDAFERSLGAFPHYRTIFNIALCHENLGNIVAAIEMYKRYYDWPSEVPNREDVGQKIEELKAKLPPEPEPEPEPEDPESTQPEKPASRVKDEVEPGNESGPNLAIPGWIAVGTGAAGVVVGGVLLLVARSKAEEMRSIEDEGTPYDSDKHDPLPKQGKSLEIGGWIVGTVGLAAVGTGVVLLLLSGSDSGEKSSVSLDVSPWNDGVKTGLTVRF
ncbi:MAG: tetratricopeptide repeat protein [Deltaproteobacteria bacterium]|nr:tetratricopeptide repeat protein [Deltaproteobacteria bacterium]